MIFIKKNIKYIVASLLLLVFTLGILHKRFDFTSDKRYTLTETTKKILSQVDKPLQFDIYLQGNFPAKYKYLQQETITLLEEYQQENSNVEFHLIDPTQDLPSLDSLKNMGLQPHKVQQNSKAEYSEMLVFPYAVAFYNGYYKKIPLLDASAGKDEEEMLSISIENLEYNISSNISNLVASHIKKIGFLTHHKELNPSSFYKFQEVMSESYDIQPFFPADTTQKGFTLQDLNRIKKLDALVIAKPRTSFTDVDKEVVDQFIMNGGKTLWMLDEVNAEMDTLYYSNKILAYPYDLKLTDLLFSYGLRVNTNIVKDAQRFALLTLVSNSNSGNKETQTFNWPYFPLGIADTEHPITKNINPVKFEFPSSIDTLANGVKKTILLQSSPYTSMMQVPSYVTLDELYNGLSDSLVMAEYNKGPKIVSVLLEGKFQSAYAGRIERKEIPNFKEESTPTKMIVISDGDVAKNQIVKNQYPLELGQDLTSKVVYGNKAFLKNAMDYLLDDSGLISLKNRNIQTKLLDEQKILNQKLKWQWINTLLPLAFVLFFGLVFTYLKRRYF